MRYLAAHNAMFIYYAYIMSFIVLPSDIDECLLQAAACDPHGAECINMEGGYICKCNGGFLGNGIECTGK